MNEHSLFYIIINYIIITGASEYQRPVKSFGKRQTEIKSY